jgi:hypothetical protein
VAGVFFSSNQSPADSPSLPLPLSKDHHFIATSRNDPVSLFPFLGKHDGDPATEVKILFLVHLTAGSLMTADRNSYQS